MAQPKRAVWRLQVGEEAPDVAAEVEVGEANGVDVFVAVATAVGVMVSVADGLDVGVEDVNSGAQAELVIRGVAVPRRAVLLEVTGPPPVPHAQDSR